MPKHGGIPDGQQDQGKSIIATSESRTNVAYGLLTTPDRVQNVVMPTDGLIAVLYQATWQESVNGAARAAIFIGANQQTINAISGPLAVAAATTAAGGGTDHPLVSHPGGLGSLGSAAASGADVTTGQAVGLVAYGGTAVPLGVELGGTVYQGVAPDATHAYLYGGPCYIFAAAGTYDVSVQFKATSGSVTAKNRKLWVWSRYFG